MTPDERRFIAIHEAGHAVVAMALGIDIKELHLGDEGGYCLHYAPTRRRSWHACSALGGVFAGAMFYRDFYDYERWNSWENCHEDLRLWNAERGGMTFRQGRRITIEILNERVDDVLALASVLSRDGFVDSTNAPWRAL